MIPVEPSFADALKDACLTKGDRGIVVCRLDFDVNGDGVLEDIVVIVGQVSRKIYFCEYANMCPFEVVTLPPAKDRWYP